MFSGSDRRFRPCPLLYMYFIVMLLETQFGYFREDSPFVYFNPFLCLQNYFWNWSAFQPRSLLNKPTQNQKCSWKSLCHLRFCAVQLGEYQKLFKWAVTAFWSCRAVFLGSSRSCVAVWWTVSTRAAVHECHLVNTNDYLAMIIHYNYAELYLHVWTSSQ